MHVGRDASSTSPGWSLLPSTVIIVLALVNSAVSPAGTSGISMRPGSAALLLYHFHRTAAPFGWCPCALC